MITSRSKLFVHGVPDTHKIWRPLQHSLGIEGVAVSLPGFSNSYPVEFHATKDEFTNWLINKIETQFSQQGPVDLIGHDWGALLVLRAASLRPELIKSWVVCNAVLDEEYNGHFFSHLWSTPILGELSMKFGPRLAIEHLLRLHGVPALLAKHESLSCDVLMRSTILKLYRSANALKFDGDWITDLVNLPPKGLVVWGDRDPWMPVPMAKRFSNKFSVPLHIERRSSHWAICERSSTIAKRLIQFWQEDE